MILTPCSKYEREMVIAQCYKSEERKSLFPRRCFLSRKWIWGKPAVVTTRVIARTASCDVKQDFWVDSREYTLFALGKRTK